MKRRKIQSNSSSAAAATEAAFVICMVGREKQNDKTYTQHIKSVLGVFAT